MRRKQREYTYEEYKRAMELLEKGYGLIEICRILGWPETKKSTLYYWKHGIIPPLAKWVAKPSKELAYAMGVLQGDGCISKNEPKHEYEIMLGVADSEFAETFSRAMSRLLNVNYYKPRWGEKERKWYVKYESKAFLTWYEKAGKQGLEGFKEYIEHDTETVKYYLRGLYDSDGSNTGNKQIRLTNSNKELLEYVQYLLKEYFGIIATGPYLQKKAGDKITINGVKTHYNNALYHISINKRVHVQKFLREIGFDVVRKQLGLRKNEKVFVKGRYMEPYRLAELGLFKLPFSDNQ